MTSLMPERPPGTFTEATRLNNAEEEFKWREGFFYSVHFFSASQKYNPIFLYQLLRILLF